jgi:hypothetical protein
MPGVVLGVTCRLDLFSGYPERQTRLALFATLKNQ